MLPDGNHFVAHRFQFFFTFFCCIVQFLYRLTGGRMLYAVPIVGVTEGTAVKHATCTEKKQYLSSIFFGESPGTPAAPPPPPSLGEKGAKCFFFKLKFSVNSYHRIRKLFLFQWDLQQIRHICNWCRVHDIHPHLEHEK